VERERAKNGKAKRGLRVTPCPCGSGRRFDDCHGREPATVAPEPAAPPPVLAPPVRNVKLDLACGQSAREGFEGVDVWPGARHVVNLMRFPWPWADNSVDELHCSHFIEHLPLRDLEERDLSGTDRTWLGRDFLFAFFDECWRILKHEGTMTVICPNARSNRAFQDPTHRRFIVAETFYYLNRDWRESQKLTHGPYDVKCHFGFNAVPIIPIELNALSPEVQQRRFNSEWNAVLDWQASLVCLKPAAASK
jgi:predicted SAM-dependent methyltransferase